MRSHFRISSGAAKACAVTGATAIMAGICSAQIAADYATDPAYAGGWSAGQNGGYGFGAWSFNGTDPTPAGQYQGISSSSALGTSWTLLSHSTSSGLANAGRAINGGLQPGQTFETVIQNPTTTSGPKYSITSTILRIGVSWMPAVVPKPPSRVPPLVRRA